MATRIRTTRVRKPSGLPGGGGLNPWLTDCALLDVAVWWVKMTHPDDPRAAYEVTGVFRALERELR